MAIKTYLYRPVSLQVADLTPLLAAGAGPIIGAPLPDSQVPITIDEIHKEDLDDAMADFGYAFVEEYTGGTPLTGRKDFGVLPTNPSGVTPGNGDMYYNSSLDMEMRYDSARAKWLSVEAAIYHFGRDGNTKATQFYRAADGRVMSSTIGWYAIRSGTVVSIGYTRADTDAATFEIVRGGITLATVASSAISGRNVALDADFTFGDILAVLNQAGGSTTSNVVGAMRVRWRA